MSDPENDKYYTREVIEEPASGAKRWVMDTKALAQALEQSIVRGVSTAVRYARVADRDTEIVTYSGGTQPEAKDSARKGEVIFSLEPDKYNAGKPSDTYIPRDEDKDGKKVSNGQYILDTQYEELLEASSPPGWKAYRLKETPRILLGVVDRPAVLRSGGTEQNLEPGAVIRESPSAAGGFVPKAISPEAFARNWTYRVNPQELQVRLNERAGVEGGIHGRPSVNPKEKGPER